jgi:hypothetical protein
MVDVILHGGYNGDWQNAGHDIALFTKLIDAANQADGRVLISFLAHDTPTDFPHLDALKDTFKNLDPHIKLTIAGLHNFLTELSHHQVMFLQGGNSVKQQAALKNISKLDLAHNKKLIVGSSSGAMALCAHGYSQRAGLFQGKGILNMALIPHADVWPITQFLPLLQSATNLPILLLNEMQMINFKGS